MSNLTPSLTARPSLLQQAEAERERRRRVRQHHLETRYRVDPCAYAAERLRVTWWAKQQEIAQAIVRYPRVLVKASNAVGKTHLAGGLALWHYECFDPGLTLTTAPTDGAVTDLLWREVRTQAPAGLPLLPRAPLIEGGKFHYARGYVARDVNAFQGRHAEHMLIVFDEAVGIRPEFWVGAEAMTASGSNKWLAICNPTDPASEAYAAEESGLWHVITISALEHPNVRAQLRGEPAPIPGAIELSKVEERLQAWCTPTTHPSAGDVEWPPGCGAWYRPGPLFESRVLGRWPTQAIDSVWSDALLQVAFREGRDPLPEPTDVPCQIGCDVARYGDDMTVLHVRRGPVSLHHESHNGWGTDQTAGRLKQLADQWGQHCGIAGQKIVCSVDDDGVGGGVVDQRDGYTFVACSGGHRAQQAADYPNRRSEVWFVVAEMARDDRLDLSRLPDAARREIRRQLMAPRWRVDSQGRRVVEPKDDTKKRIHRSPDDADAVNLAYTSGGKRRIGWS